MYSDDESSYQNEGILTGSRVEDTVIEVLYEFFRL